MLNTWDIPKIDAVMELGNPDDNDRESWYRIKKELEELSKTPTNTTKAKIKPCENDNCPNFSEDYEYNCCYFMDCKERV